MTIDELIGEMLDFGLDLDLAERIAPALLPLFNDHRGFRKALLAEEPRVAERIGVTRRH